MSDAHPQGAISASLDAVERVTQRFDSALRQLAGAKRFVRPRYQPEVLRLAAELLDSAGGIRALYERADRFEDAGVFHGGPWAETSSLQPHLVGGCLRGEGSASTIEALSELRILAAATGRCSSRTLTEHTARRFLRDVVAQNLDLLFPRPSDDPPGRSRLGERARRLFALIGAELSLDGLRREVTEEVLDLAAQRPIVTARIRNLIELASNLPPAGAQEDNDALELFQGCLRGPSALSREHADAPGYREALQRASLEALEHEASQLGASLRETGVAHEHHAILLRRLAAHAPALLARALGLDATGRLELDEHLTVVVQLIKASIAPGTADAVLGLACLLERRVLSEPGVIPGLRALIELDILPDVERTLLMSRPRDAGLAANTVLASGALSVLGQPLGIGQGQNSTCQAARGISLWAAHAPAMLLEWVTRAARDGALELELEGVKLRSNEVSSRPLDAADLRLDPIQIVLVPHLNRLYDEMLARTSLRATDAHKWVNPAMYGRWVPKGFASFIDPRTQTIAGYRDFLRRFFATHHPAYSDDAPLPYPNPVGLLVTDARGRYLGPHAVAIQRVARDPSGALRVYFFNPNNDGRQRWAPNIAPGVRGSGEIAGESSLPIIQFASRLYAFHYDPYHQGDAYAVPEAMLREVEKLAKESWADAFAWSEPLT